MKHGYVKYVKHDLREYPTYAYDDPLFKQWKELKDLGGESFDILLK